MSKDLKIVNGDISLTPDGDIITIEDSEKLKQDLLKISLTKQNSNIFHSWYGNAIGLSSIGRAAHLPSLVKNTASSALREALSNLIRLQNEQRLRQEVTPGELIYAINNINVEQDEIDPRQYNIKYFVITESLVELNDSLLFRPF